MCNILRSDGNQTIQFAQLIEYSMRNIFLEKSYKKSGGESSPRPFSWKLKLSISLDQYLKVLYCLFLLYCKLRLPKYTETKLQTTCFYLILSIFFSIKRILELVPLPDFLHNLWIKMFLLLNSMNWPSFSVCLPLYFEILGNMCIVFVTRLWFWN